MTKIHKWLRCPNKKIDQVKIIDIFKLRVCVDDKLSMDVRIEFNIQQQKILGKLLWSVFKNSSV